MSQSGGKKYVSKRIKVKTVPFELDDTITTHKRRSAGGGNDSRILIYQRNEFLAVRNDTDGFFLCRALQHVYETTRRFNIQWLEKFADDDNAYDLAYKDMLDKDCILTDVKLRKKGKNSYTLPLNQKQKAEKALAKAVEGRDSSDDDDDEDESDAEPPKKKAKLDGPSKQLKKGSSTKAKAQKKTAKGSVVKKGSLTKKTSSVVVAAKGIKKRVLQKAGAKGSKAGKKSEKKKAEPAKKGKGRGVLVPRPSVKVLEKDPMLHSKEKVPFVSSLAHSKLVMRAVFQDDLKLLTELIADRNHVAKLDIIYSQGLELSPLEIALKRGNLSIIGPLCKELFAKDSYLRPRVALPTSMLQSESVGQYNKLSLHGLPFIRKLNMSRGSKEGNNAFTKDLNNTDRGSQWHSFLSYIVSQGPSKTLLDKYCAQTADPAQAKSLCLSHIHVAIQYGHRKLAAALVEDCTKTGLTNFNFLHYDVMAFDHQPLRSGIREASVKKTPFDNQKVTPLHCAAINPNPKYLSQLLEIHPDYNISDSCKRRLLHYAVVCEATGPLQLLLDSRKVNCMETDSFGATALFAACLAGRTHNVRLLLAHTKQASEDVKTTGDKSKAKSGDDEKAPPPTLDKFGLCGINMGVSRPHNKYFSYTPLHLVAQEGKLDIVKVLLEYGADINKELSASKNKVTPLMLAAAHGEIDVMRLLIKQGAKVNQKDKLKRTPMMLAAMNGQAHIVSFLLSLGCSANDQDSSGNAALHYAAGYGWYFCVKVLLEAGANPSAGNDWKTTPLAVAFLKGHIGLADILLEQPSVDINFRLDGGMTLVHMACASALEEGIVEQLEYLAVKKNADCTLMDDSNSNALHHLAQNNVNIESPPDTCIERSLKMAEMLLQRGCDPSAVDANAMTPLIFAIQKGNQPLVELLVKNGAKISNTVDKENRNVLHFLSDLCMMQSMVDILKLLHKTSGESGVLTEMVKQVDNSGMTPLICACLKYSRWNEVLSTSGSSYKVQSSEDSSEDEDEEEASEDNNDEADEEEEDKDKQSDEDDTKSKSDDADLKMEVDEAGTSEKKENASTSPANTQEEKVKQQWEAGRNYIQTLIKICGDATGIPLQKKVFKSTDTVPEKLEDQYFDRSVAGFSAIHFLVGNQNERSADVVDGNTTNFEYCPGLAVVLNCLKKKSDAEQYNCFGRTPLLQAIALKRNKAAETLIRYGVDVNSKSRDKETDGLSTPLVLAARHSENRVIELLVQHGARVNEKDVNNDYTALHYIIKAPVSSYFKQVVECLVTSKASVTEVDKHQKTALHLLMEHSRDVSDAVAVAGLLLSAGASIDACDRKGRTPLHLAVNANSGNVNTSTEMEQFLLDKGANQFARDWLQRLPLHYVFVKIGKHSDVSAMDPVELCSTLTSSTNKPSSMVNYGDQFGLTPLHVAARRGAGVCCLHLIKKGSNVNGRDFDGNTPLSLAITNKHESCTILLLQQNADISGNIVIVPPPPKQEAENADITKTEKEKKVKPEWKWNQLKQVKKPLETKTYSIFQGVVSQDWQGIIFLMLDLLEKFNLNLLSVVQAALVTKKYHLALMLIRKARGKNELTSKMENDQNLAHVLAKASQSTNSDNLITLVAQMLFEKGVLFDADDEYGCTPLHYACLQGNKSLVLFILENCKKINLEKKDKLGRTAMAAVFWKLGHPGCNPISLVTILREHGATLDLLCSYPSQQIFMFGHKRVLEEEDYLRSTASNPLISPLMLSIIHHNFHLTHELIERGANVNFADLEGRTPLMVAVQENSIHLVRLLLDLSYKETANDEDELPVEPTVSSGKGKQQSRKAFALVRRMHKLPSIQGNVVQGQTTGANSKLTIVNGLNMSAKIYPKTSAVNAKALDCHGRSALHYLVQPQLNGSFDNYRLLQQLVAIGAPLEQADKDGKTLMDYAMAKGLTKLATTVQYLLDSKTAKFATPKCAASAVCDGISWATSAPDFVSDSEKFIEKFEQNLATEEGKTETEYKAVPDRHLSEFTTGQVHIDTDLNLPYDVLLTKIDVGAGIWGLYNFYKMQIVHQKGKDLYVLFTRWGRIGDSGNFQQTPFPQQEDAVKEFRKIFRAKTSNDWQTATTNFVPQPRKYRLVPLDQRCFGRKSIDIPIDLTTSFPSKLHPYVQDVIKELTDMAMLTNSMDQLGIDRSLVPLGRIKKESLFKAKEILVKLKVLVKNVEKMRSEIAVTDMEKYAAELEKIASLTNEYYHLLPKSGFEFERIPILDNESVLGTEWKNIDALMELEIATKIIIGAQFAIKETNPMDYIYRCLKCQIRLMDENETEAQYLLRYASATWHGKVEAIFRISRDGEDARFASCGVNNHRLLFHGSSSSNLISILSKGLLITPADAPTCGSAFGNGIYTADRFSKSHAYCFNYSGNSKVKYMLVCEVALGKTKDLCTIEYQEKAPTGFQSVCGLGQKQPDAQFDLTLPTGAVIPLGATTDHRKVGDQYVCLGESEFIVYKESQVCLRYLIQFIS